MRGLRKRDFFRIEGYTASEADPVDRGEAQPSWFKCPHLRSRQAPPRPCRGRPPRSRAASGGHRGIVFRFGFADIFYNFKFGFVGEFVRREKPSPSRLRRATSPGVSLESEVA